MDSITTQYQVRWRVEGWGMGRWRAREREKRRKGRRGEERRKGSREEEIGGERKREGVARTLTSCNFSRKIFRFRIT